MIFQVSKFFFWRKVKGAAEDVAADDGMLTRFVGSLWSCRLRGFPSSGLPNFIPKLHAIIIKAYGFTKKMI